MAILDLVTPDYRYAAFRQCTDGALRRRVDGARILISATIRLHGQQYFDQLVSPPAERKKLSLHPATINVQASFNCR